MSLNGIDISNWQSTINLSAIKADFIIVKSSEGIDWADPSFPKLFKAAKQTGKKLGVYHFARPTTDNDPVKEADSFINIIKPEGVIGNAILVLDWEAENQQNTAYAKKWMDRVYEKTKVKPLIYMSENVTKIYDWSAVAKEYDLWVAKYRDNELDYNYNMASAGSKPVVKYWKDYKLWQWTSSGKLDGYSGKLDCNIFYGDKKDWDKMASIPKKNGWKKENGVWYYYKEDKRLTGWHKLAWNEEQNWYYFNASGKMLTGWQQLKWSKGTDWFYFSSGGAMQTGWKKLTWKNKQNWYYFNLSSGAMEKSKVISGQITLGKDGTISNIK